MTVTAGPATLDLLRPGFRVVSDEVREAARRHWYAETTLGPAILTYDDCIALQHDRRMHQAGADHLTAQGLTEGPVADLWARLVLNIEGPDHHRLRRLVNPAFNTASVERLRARMRELTHSLVDSFAPNGRCEFMAAFADLYPPRVMFDLLGIPRSEHESFLRWGKDLAQLLSYDVPAQHDRIATAIAELGEATDRLCEQRRAEPGADLISRLVAAADGDDRLSQEELRAMVVVLVVGGQDSTRNQLGLGLATFAEYPEQWTLLGERPELASAATEEIVRMNSVVPVMWRLAPVDIDYRDLHIAAGTRIWLMAALAQRESGVPGKDAPFDITAEPRPHLAFGHGTHYCMGAYLARMEMTEALPILARRLPDLALDGEGVFRPELSGFVGPESLPIRFTPTAI